MKSIFVATLLASATFTALPASAAIETHLQCYNAVITSCNANAANPQSCASNGMDQCDEQFPQTAQGNSRPLTLTDNGGRVIPGALAVRLGVARRN